MNTKLLAVVTPPYIHHYGLDSLQPKNFVKSTPQATSSPRTYKNGLIAFVGGGEWQIWNCLYHPLYFGISVHWAAKTQPDSVANSTYRGRASH